MRKYSWILACAFVTSLLGCRAAYNVDNLAGGSAARLDRQKMVYVLIPADGAYAGRPYSGSGQTVAQSVASAFAGVADRVQIADRRFESDSVAISAAKGAGADYVVIPVIAHWEQRNTAWSGIPSRMAIRLTIVDAATGKQLASTSIEGRSRVVSFTATNPDSLLREPLRQYVRGLYYL